MVCWRLVGWLMEARMTDWRKVCLELLDHFDANEGTTYLYNEDDRRSFASGFDNPAEVQAMLDEYHTRALLPK